MKLINKASDVIKKTITATSLFLFTASLYAKDLLNNALEGDVKDTLGSDGTIWKFYILADIIIALTAAIKTKSYVVFFGVMVIVFVPGFLLKTFVFG